MSLTLYEVNELYETIIEQAMAEAAENEGVIPDELADALEEIEASREQKFLNCGHYYKNKMAETEAFDAEIKKLQARKKSSAFAAEWAKNHIMKYLPEGEKYSSSTVALGWRKSEAVEITDTAAIPEELCKITIEPSKTAIKTAIKAGQVVPGAQLINKLNLQIK